jgi:hypothetical protein
MPNPLISVADWKKATKGKGEADKADAIQMLLMSYHRVAGTDVEERARLIQAIADAAHKYTSEHRPDASLYAAMFDIGTQSTKALTTIGKAQQGWGKVKQVFGPSGSSLGKTNPLQHYQKGAINPTSFKNYWLEGLDPKHRSWGHMDRSLFDRWLADAATTLGFWAWLEDKGLGGGMPSVAYLAPDQRWKYLCIFSHDKIMYQYQATMGARGSGAIPLQRFTTFGMSTAHSGRNFAIWVASGSGAFYSATHVVSQFHHSSFLAGGRVLAAGEWVVSAGKILLISHKTGHHAASEANLFSALKVLDTRLDLSRTVVMAMNFATGANKYVTVREFMTKGGNAAACAEIRDSASGAVMDMAAQAQIRCDRHIDWDARGAVTPRAYVSPP